MKIFFLFAFSLFVSGCSVPLVPKDPTIALIQFGNDSSSWDWELETQNHFIDGIPVDWTTTEVPLPPGMHLVNLRWLITETGSSNPSEKGLTFNTTKGGLCEIAASFDAGKGYKVGVTLEDGGSWISDPEVWIRIFDGVTDEELVSKPCSYKGRGLAPGYVF